MIANIRTSNCKIFSLLLINTWRKEYRSKTLFFLVFIWAVVGLTLHGLLSFFAEELTSDPTFQNYLKVGDFQSMHNFITVSSIILSSLLGVGCMRSDLEYSTLPYLFSLPINKKQYIFARLLGTWSIASTYTMGTMLTGLGLMSFHRGSSYISGDILLSYFFSIINLLALITLAALISLYLSRIISFVIVLLIKVVVNFSNVLTDMFGVTGDFSLINITNALSYYLLPRMGHMDQLAQDVLKGPLPAFQFTQVFHYCFSCGILLWLIFLTLKNGASSFRLTNAANIDFRYP